MEYLLPAALILGAFLFILSWIMVVVFGFKHHPVTGLVAMMPGLNVLILPTIWHRVRAWFITGLVGLLIAAAAWGLGALDQISKHGLHLSSKVGLPNNTMGFESVNQTHTNANPVQATSPTVPLSLPAAGTKPTQASTATNAAPTASAPATLVTEPLPNAALYKLVFEGIQVSKLEDYEEQYVRLIQHDGRKREGTLLELKGDELMLEERNAGQSSNSPIKLNSIRQAAVLVKQ